MLPYLFIKRSLTQEKSTCTIFSTYINSKLNHQSLYINESDYIWQENNTEPI